MAAVLLQALNRNMMRLFDAVSSNRNDPQGRAARTGQYILTTVFADTAHAQAAGAMVRRLHAHTTWTDPTTGEVLAPDKPAWLAWTHNTLVWGVLRACDMYGPKLTPAEQDRLIAEQFRSAELVGLDPATLPATRSALDRYIDGQKGWLAMTLPAAETTTSLRRPKLWGNPFKMIPALFLQDGILALLPEWARKLYGIDGRAVTLRLARTLTRGMLAAARRSKAYKPGGVGGGGRGRGAPLRPISKVTEAVLGSQEWRETCLRSFATARPKEFPRPKPIPIRREKL
jgi:uncharacterized protein (DUF2236 family)